MPTTLARALLTNVKIILTAIALMAPLTVFAQGPACSSVFSDSKPAATTPFEINGSFRKTSGGSFMAFRSNAPHYWNWLRQNKTSLMSPRGVVTGDPHILNFGDVQLKDGGGKFGLIDIDDGGVNAPLAGDFLRYFIGNQISPYKVVPKDLFKSYIDGLNGKKMDKPRYLIKMRDKTDRDFYSLQEKRLSKMTMKDSFSSEAGLIRLEDVSPEVHTLYEQSLPAFKNEMTGYRILDVGYRLKETGGSQYLPRFYFLIEKDNERHIWEFKLEMEPAISLFTHQPDAHTRFQYIVNTYRPADPMGPYRFVQAGDHVFLLRERLYSSVNLDPAKIASDKDIQNGKDMSLFIANRMGLAHGSQPSGQDLKTRLQEPGALESLNTLANDYISMIKKLNND
ncbi:DUF2252 family protein [Bdellovibrio sp. KM01]|uniref:DUF2252 family protein n=1 Tax=Bdellovibrio sp. KM01 TaxID=2748865 RepID=UPI0015E93C03|nr:DUF2252 family protein [Bdellovibrio sp. KM01]QLY24274.1 hypothetical protein HW988_12455 [Bdellovibrio sp. KM01]